MGQGEEFLLVFGREVGKVSKDVIRGGFAIGDCVEKVRSAERVLLLMSIYALVAGSRRTGLSLSISSPRYVG